MASTTTWLNSRWGNSVHEDALASSNDAEAWTADFGPAWPFDPQAYGGAGHRRSAIKLEFTWSGSEAGGAEFNIGEHAFNSSWDVLYANVGATRIKAASYAPPIALPALDIQPLVNPADLSENVGFSFTRSSAQAVAAIPTPQVELGSIAPNPRGPGTSALNFYADPYADLLFQPYLSLGDVAITNIRIKTGQGTITSDIGIVSYTPVEGDFSEVIFEYDVLEITNPDAPPIVGTARLDILPNRPPVFVAPSLSVDEDTQLTLDAATLLALSSDPDGDRLSLTSGVLGGPIGPVSVQTAGGELTSLVLRGALNDTSSITLDLVISDGTTTVPGSVIIDLLPVNDAPTLSATAFNLSATDENTNSTPVAVADLLAQAGQADVDVGALKGLAVTGSTGQGQWQYSVGGTTWVPVGTVSATSALLLGPATSVRYVPDANNGETATLSFRAWDQTSGTASTDASRNTADTTTNGGTTAFSTASTTASLVVNAVNDGPANTVPGSISVTEDVASALSGISVADVDAGSGLVTMTLSVPSGTLAATAGGGVTVAGAGTGSVTLGGTVGDLNTYLAASSVAYTTAPNANGSVTLTVLTSDNGNTGSGGALTDTDSVTLAITPVNDAPTTSPVTLPAMAEDSGTRTITQTLLLGNAFDEDGPALKAENLQVVGSLGSLVDNGNGSWNFTPAANDDTSVSFTYRISDGTDTVAGSATLDLTPVNDAPVAANDSAVTRLNAPVSIAVLANDSDVDGGPLSVTGVTPASAGTAAVQPGGLTVLYTPNTGFSGFDSFNYTVSDGVGGTATASVRVLVASITGSNGNDTTLGTQQADFVVALDGNDRILTHDGADYVDGGRGADTITGGAGADTLLGGDGPDTFLASSSELAGDQIDGGDGTDILVITNAPASLPANFSFTNLEQISYTGGLLVEHTSLLDLSSLTLASGSSNSITGGTANSRITGTASADNIVDSAGNDDLRGAGGNDTIQGGFGQDTINGGTGNDVLYGGSATAANDFVRDIFVFNTPLNATTNVDQIIGFQANSQDRIELSTSIFAAITGGATSGLDADEFRSVAGGNAQDSNDFILFDPTTGNLFHDADGNGPGAKVLFATLVGLNGTLDVTDFGVAESPF